MVNENGLANRQTKSSSNTDSTEELQPIIDPSLLHSLEWRLIGPFRGGRVVAVAGDPAHPLVFYFGSTGGGVWKTTDGGLVWENVSDGFFKRASVGAIAVSNSDPNVIYVGMGETTILRTGDNSAFLTLPAPLPRSLPGTDTHRFADRPAL